MNDINAKNRLKRRFFTALITTLIALFTIVSATFAWYIYNTAAHTTNVHMAAGTSISLQISNTYDGEYNSSSLLDSFTGTLNPVSGNRIDQGKGFQKVLGFTNGSENQSKLVANLFGPSETSDFYQSKLYLRTNGDKMDVYISDITFDDDDEEHPISSAIRVGFEVHKPGKDQTVSEEFIFAISDKVNDLDGYNTATGEEGYVLDSVKKDGSTVPFKPYDKTNYCNYNTVTSDISLKEDSVPLCSVQGDGNGGYGEAVELTVYIWLEGCDRDCTQTLCSKTLKNLAIMFAGYRAQ